MQFVTTDEYIEWYNGLVPRLLNVECSSPEEYYNNCVAPVVEESEAIIPPTVLVDFHNQLTSNYRNIRELLMIGDFDQSYANSVKLYYELKVFFDALPDEIKNRLVFGAA